MKRQETVKLPTPYVDLVAALLRELRAAERGVVSSGNALRCHIDRTLREIERPNGVLNTVGELQAATSAFEASVGAVSRLRTALAGTPREILAELETAGPTKSGY